MLVSRAIALFEMVDRRQEMLVVGHWCRFNPNIFCQEKDCENCEIERKVES